MRKLWYHLNVDHTVNVSKDIVIVLFQKESREENQTYIME